MTAVGGTWLPIETAPRDGDQFLAYGPELGWQVVDYDPSEKHPDWVWAVMDGATYHRDGFTHWMPLPDPPETVA